MNEQIVVAVITGISSVLAAFASGGLAAFVSGELSRKKPKPLSRSRLWLILVGGVVVGLVLGGIAGSVVYLIGGQNVPQVSFSATSDKLQCTATGNYIYLCPVHVKVSGLPSNTRLLFWVRPHNQPNWYLQTTNITSSSVGEWEALLPVGSELTPPKINDLFDIAVTVVTGSQQNGTTNDPFATALVSASLQDQAIQLTPSPDLPVVKITNPTFGATVPGKFVAEGTYANLPSLLQLWLIPYSHEAAKYFPQGTYPQVGPALLQSNTTWTSPPPRDDGTWTSPPIYLGPAVKDTGWDLYVGLVGSKGQGCLKQYLNQGAQTHDFPGRSWEDLNSCEIELISSIPVYGPKQ